MRVLLLCLAWNALHGFVLVKLLEGDLLSQVTMSDSNHFAMYDLAVLYTSKAMSTFIFIMLILSILQAICHYFFEEKMLRLVVNKPQ